MENVMYLIDESMRPFAGPGPSDKLSGKITLSNFRYFIEKYKFGKHLFDSVQAISMAAVNTIGSKHC